MDVIFDTLRPEKIKEALENEEATLLTGQFHQKCFIFLWMYMYLTKFIVSIK